MSRHGIVILATASAMLVGALTSLAPGLSWLDAGDFVAATATLGVPHPTGFPATTLGGHALTWLPIGSIPTRVALLSALCMAAAGGLLLATLARLRLRPIPLAAIGVLLVVSQLTVPTLYIHARVPEIYATNLLLVSGGLHLLVRFRASGDARLLAALGLLLGLSVTHHALFRLWAPVLALAALWPGATISLALPRRATLLAIPGLVGLLAWAYLPAAAAGAPAHNWGQPDTFARFWDHIHAATVRAAFDDAMLPGVTQLAFNSLEVFSQLVAGIGPFVFLGPVAAIAALVLLVRRPEDAPWRRQLHAAAVVAGVLAGLDIAYAAAINPMGNRDLQNLQISSTLLLLLGAGGLLRIVTSLQLRARVDAPDDETPLPPAEDIPPEDEPSSLPGTITLVALALVLLTVIPHGQEGIGNDTSLEDLLVAHLADAEAGSLSTTVSDSLTAGFLYATTTLGQRPDAVFLNRNDLTQPEALAWFQRRAPIALVEPGTLEGWREEGLGHFAVRNLAVLQAHLDVRPLWWEIRPGAHDLPEDVVALPAWPLARIVHEDDARDLDPGARLCAGPSLRTWCDGRAEIPWGLAAREASGGDFVEYRQFLASQHAVIGTAWLEARQLEPATAWFGAAVETFPEAAGHHVRLAVARATAGELEEALAILEHALRLRPDSRLALRNGVLYAEALGDEERRERFERRLERLTR